MVTLTSRLNAAVCLLALVVLFVTRSSIAGLLVAGDTLLTPRQLLALALRVEAELGRVRTVKDGPRTLDVDVLLWSDRVIDEPGLRVPHPRLHLRRFVLVPLCEIAPGVLHPGLGQTLAELLASCPDGSAVRCFPGRA